MANREEQQIALLLGAGFMAPILPTAIGLTEKLRSLLDSGEPRISSRDIDIYRYLEGAIRFQRGVRGFNPGDAVNIEEIANSALRLAERDSAALAPHVLGWHPRLSQLCEQSPDALNGFVSLIYNNLSRWLEIHDRSSVSYVQHLSQFLKICAPLDIFTLNYDLGIEFAMAGLKGALRVDVATGFSESGWSPGSFGNAEHVRLHKLHGSLDWVDHQQLGLCSLRYPPHQDVNLIESEARPLLIFGTDFKMTGREPFLTLLYRFSHRLSEIDALVVIGYSFADEYINDIIRQRMEVNRRMRIVIADPNAEALALRFGQSSRVYPFKCFASEALGDNSMISKLADVLASISEDKPFG
jgi:hypothetical protein